jgi:hypothetical protein
MKETWYISERMIKVNMNVSWICFNTELRLSFVFTFSQSLQPIRYFVIGAYFGPAGSASPDHRSWRNIKEMFYCMPQQ